MPSKIRAFMEKEIRKATVRGQQAGNTATMSIKEAMANSNMALNEYVEKEIIDRVSADASQTLLNRKDRIVNAICNDIEVTPDLKLDDAIEEALAKTEHGLMQVLINEGFVETQGCADVSSMELVARNLYLLDSASIYDEGSSAGGAIFDTSLLILAENISREIVHGNVIALTGDPVRALTKSVADGVMDQISSACEKACVPRVPINVGTELHMEAMMASEGAKIFFIYHELWHIYGDHFSASRHEQYLSNPSNIQYANQILDRIQGSTETRKHKISYDEVLEKMFMLDRESNSDSWAANLMMASIPFRTNDENYIISLIVSYLIGAIVGIYTVDLIERYVYFHMTGNLINENKIVGYTAGRKVDRNEIQRTVDNNAMWADVESVLFRAGHPDPTTRVFSVVSPDVV